MSYSTNKKIVELVDLPDELILNIMKKVDPQTLLLCSMVNIGNNRLERLAFDKCHSIDLTFTCFQQQHKLLIERFYTDVLPRVIYNIKSLSINCYQALSIKRFFENNAIGILSNITHVNIMIGFKNPRTGTTFTIAYRNIFRSKLCAPLVTDLSQYLLGPHSCVDEKIITICRLPFMHFVQSFEIDENLILYHTLDKDHSYFNQLKRLTHLRISLHSFDRCVHLLNQVGSQLQSLIITIAITFEIQLDLIRKIQSISCPNLKQMKMIMYRNFTHYELCISLLQRMVNVEYLTLLLAIGKDGIRPAHFIDGSILKKQILQYMPHLRQFNYHIRSILENRSHITIDQIRQTFLEYDQSFDCVLDYFDNNYRQCQVYSLPFIGTRLDFISNRFPLFDAKNTFSNVTILLLFDDVKPFESIFFERLAQALPRLQTLEIHNQLEQQEKSISIMKTNIDFPHLTVLILQHIHIDYVYQLFYQSYLPSLVELAIDNDILFTIIEENQQQARDNCSNVEAIFIFNEIYQPMDVILNFFPNADYINDKEERVIKK